MLSALRIHLFGRLIRHSMCHSLRPELRKPHRHLALLLASGLLALPAAAQPRSAADMVFAIQQGALCLDVNPAQARVSGARAMMIVCDGRASQGWRLDRGRIVNAAIGRCLDLHEPDLGTSGGRIQLADCQDSAQQAWRQDRAQWMSMADGRCLEVAPVEAGFSGARVQSGDCRPGAPQAFALEPQARSAAAARDVEAGPIFSQAQAQDRCPAVCAPQRWTGHWRTTVPGRMSVCNCTLGEPAPVAGTPSRPAPAGPVPIADARLDALLRAIEVEAFSTSKLAVLQAAAGDHRFTIAQLRRIVEAFTFSSDRIKAVELVAPRVLDRQNAFELSSAFGFDSERQQVRAIFERLR